MEMNAFGAKVRQLREEKGLTREAFCEDELDLTVRQLTRIESGESKPTFAKVQFIAARLGLTLFQVMPDYVEIPMVYKRLKYDVIRLPDYHKQEVIEARDESINKMYDEFYDILPTEEQLVLDVLRSIFDVRATRSSVYGKDILSEYFDEVIKKDIYTTTDLLIIRLFVEHFRVESNEENKSSLEIFNYLSKKIVEQVEFISSDELFILRDVIFAMIGASGDKKLYQEIPDLIACLEGIMAKTQDFQKMPILKLVTWKYQLFACKNIEKAKEEFEQSIIFAKSLGDKHLIEKLEKEWQGDSKK